MNSWNKVDWKKIISKRTLMLCLLFASMFMLGRTVGYAVHYASGRNVRILRAENWGLGFGKEGSKPTGNVTPQELEKFDGYYIGPDEEKVIYLTFDCGFENGNTEAILDALKKHDVKATFFVVGHFLESAPEMVKRMVAEGHTVGNHTYHHPDMSKISDLKSFQKEMDDASNLFQEITGQKMSMYYRPPQGKYSNENLKMAQQLGYKTFFWSLAYVDWYQDKQPSHQEAYKKLLGRVHPGAVVLLHNTSKTNGEIMDELLTKWEEMGYSFRTLGEMTGEAPVGGTDGEGQDTGGMEEIKRAEEQKQTGEPKTGKDMKSILTQ